MGLLRDEPILDVGSTIGRILTPGAIGNLYVYSEEMAEYGVTSAWYVPETNHTIATPFWEFMNASGTVYEDGQYIHDQLFKNPFYATGLPVTEPYWATVPLAGVSTNVLIQCFERRCLTYTPSNPEGWKVEAGNVGQHYYQWRHGRGPEVPSPTPTPTPTPSPTPTPPVQKEQLSYWWVQPDLAAFNAIQELCECKPSLSNPRVFDTVKEHSWVYRHLYNLVTVDTGSFNRDTLNFYEWQKEYLRLLYFAPAGEQPNYFSNVNKAAEVQMYAAIYDRESAIGQQIRRIEAGQDPLFDDLGISGPEVYWHYLISPAANYTRLSDRHRTVARQIFEQFVDEYSIDFSFTGDFGDYLAYREFRLF